MFKVVLIDGRSKSTNYFFKNRWRGSPYNTWNARDAKKFDTEGEAEAYLNKFPELKERYRVEKAWICLEHTYCSCSGPKEEQKNERPPTCNLGSNCFRLLPDATECTCGWKKEPFTIDKVEVKGNEINVDLTVRPNK